MQGQLTGSLVLALEDTESRMSRIGKNLLVRSEFRSVDDEIAAIRAVTIDQVAGRAASMLRQPLSAAIVGPFGGEDDLPGELRALVG